MFRKFTAYPKAWFNTPPNLWFAGEGIINFLANQPPFKQKRSLRYPGACSKLDPQKIPRDKNGSIRTNFLKTTKKQEY
jgi:hypothetical protein